MEPNQLRDLTPLGPAHRVFSALAPDGPQVALKTFSLRQAASWKQLELFEREADILTQPLWLLGVVLAYLGWVAGREYLAYRRLTSASVKLRLRAEELVIERRVGGRLERRAIPRATVKAVLCEEAGWNPLETGVRIQAHFAQPHVLNFVRLGQTLSPEEQEWLCRLPLRWQKTAGSENESGP